jgi:hypothetical protein
MPNWCQNKLTIAGTKTEVAAFKEQAVGHSPWLTPDELVGETPNPLNFHSLVPIPDPVLAAGYDAAAYEWEKTNWGCKWGAANSTVLGEREGHIEYEFDTAWSPPMEFLQTVAKKWSNLVFFLEYDEPGMGFKGLAKFKGEVCEDHCVSF